MKPTAIACALAAFIFSATLAAQAATSTTNSATQPKAQDGCLNQWMTNGMWRMRVTDVAYQAKTIDRYNAWLVTMQWQNPTTIKDLTPHATGKESLELGLANGDTIGANDLTTTLLGQQKLDFHNFPVSGQYTYTQLFGSNDTLDPSNKPSSLLVSFDVAPYQKGHPSGPYWTQKMPAYNYRIKLDCSK